MGTLTESLEQVFRGTSEDKSATAKQVKDAARSVYRLVENTFRALRETSEERRGALNTALIEITDRMDTQQASINKAEAAINGVAQKLGELEPAWNRKFDAIRQTVCDKVQEYQTKVKEAVARLDHRASALQQDKNDSVQRFGELASRIDDISTRITAIENKLAGRVEDTEYDSEFEDEDNNSLQEDTDHDGSSGEESRDDDSEGCKGNMAGHIRDGATDGRDDDDGEKTDGRDDDDGDKSDGCDDDDSGGNNRAVQVHSTDKGELRRAGARVTPTPINVWMLSHAERALPTFSGNGEDDFSEWSTRMKDHLEYAADADMTEERKLGFLKSKLTGRARRTFEALQADRRNTVDTAVTNLKNEFARLQTPQAALSRLHEYPALTPGRRILDYAEKLETLVQRAFPTKPNEFIQERLYEEFTQRLPHEMRGQVLQANPATYANALELATKLEFHNSSGGRDTAQQVAEVVQDEMSVLRKQLETLRTELQDALRPRPETTRRQVGRVITCYRCGYQGHIMRDCPRGPQPGQASNQTRSPLTRMGQPPQTVPPRQVNSVEPTESEEDRLRRHIGALKQHNDRLVGEIEAQLAGDFNTGVMTICELRQGLNTKQKEVKIRCDRLGNATCMLILCSLLGVASGQLMLCQKDVPQTVMRLPKTLGCPITAEHQWSTDPTDVTIFRPSIGRTNFTAIMCSCVRQRASYWTTLENEHRQNITEETLPLDEEECRRMWKKKTSPSGQMTRTGELLKTSNQLHFEYPWPIIGSFTTRYTEATNCFAHEVVIWHEADSLQLHTVIGDARECRIEDGRCHLESGAVLIWEKRSHQICRYEVLGSWRGFAGNRTWITETGEFLLSFQHEHLIEECGQKLIVADQGYAISQDAAKRLVLTTRTKRSSSGLVQSEQLAAQLAAVNEATINRLIRLSGSACEARDFGWTAMLSTLLLQPSMIVRRLIRQEFVQAEVLAANTVRLWPCQAIAQEQWQPRATTECTLELPVTVNLGSQTLQAYADTVTGIVSHRRTTVDCELATPWRVVPGRDKEFNLISGANRQLPIKKWTPAHTAEALGTGPLPTTFHDLILTEARALLPLDNIEQSLREARVQAEVQKQLGSSIDRHLQTDSTAASLVRRGWWAFLIGEEIDIRECWMCVCCLWVSFLFIRDVIVPLAIVYLLNGRVAVALSYALRKAQDQQSQNERGGQRYELREVTTEERRQAASRWPPEVLCLGARLIIHVKINGHTFRAMLDTGADMSIASRKVARIFRSKPTQTTDCVTTATGEQIPLQTGETVAVHIASTRIHIFLHGGDLPCFKEGVDIILGVNCMTALPAFELDFKKNILVLRKESVPFSLSVTSKGRVSAENGDCDRCSEEEDKHAGYAQFMRDDQEDRNTNKKSDSPREAVYTLPHDYRLPQSVVMVKVNGINVRALIDTGASVSLAPAELLDLFQVSKSQLDAAPLPVETASGHELRIIGTKVVTLRVGSHSTQIRMCFADGLTTSIRHDVILGVDSLRMLPPITFDYTDWRVRLHGQELPLGYLYEPGKIMAVTTVRIPPHSASVIEVKMGSGLKAPLYLAEPKELPKAQLIAAAFTFQGKECGKLMMINGSDEYATVYEKMTLGVAHPVTVPFVLDEKRHNVAITRARCSLIVIAGERLSREDPWHHTFMCMASRGLTGPPPLALTANEARLAQQLERL